MTEPGSSRSAEAIWGLQILRFVAAAMVLFSHLNHEVLQRPALANGFTPFQPVWWAGGVDVFFVISGFIMYHISAGQFGRPGAVIRFVERRVVRLVPPYWLFTALALLALVLVPGQMAHNHVSLAQVAGSFLFLPVAAPDGHPTPVLILGWTLEFEMLFYAIFAVGLGFSRRRGLMVITAALLALVGLSFAQPLPLPLGFWASNIVLEFLFGIALARAFGAGLRVRAHFGALFVIAGVAALLWVQAMGWPGHAWNWRFAWAGLPSLAICAGVVLVRAPSRPGALARPFVVLGDASFALYLSHPFTLSLVAMAVQHFGYLGAWGYIAVAFAACVAASYVIHIGLERPFHTWITARLAPARATPRPRTAVLPAS
jgi:exopolysaccharide production protein ExoZ